MKTFKKIFPYVYGAMLVSLIVLNTYGGVFRGLETNDINMAIAYAVALIWFIFWRLYVDLLEKHSKMLDEMFKMNDAMFDQLKKQSPK